MTSSDGQGRRASGDLAGTLGAGRLRALVAEWREAADGAHETAQRRSECNRPVEANRWEAVGHTWSEAADTLEAALTEHVPEMHRVAYGDGKTALVSGPVGERMAAADGVRDDES